MIEHPDPLADPTHVEKPDSAEGLKRTLSAMYAHTSNLVVSATLAHLL